MSSISWKKELENSQRARTMLYTFCKDYKDILAGAKTKKDFIMQIRKKMRPFDADKSLFNKFRIIADIAGNSNISLLDIGSETANTANIAKKAIPNVTFRGVNIKIEHDESYNYSGSISSLKTPPKWFKWYNGVDIPFGEKSFDVISIFWVLHHVSDLEGLARDCMRVIRPRGHIVIRDHNAYNDDIKNVVMLEHEIYADNAHIEKLYSMEEIVKLFMGLGCAVSNKTKYPTDNWNYHAKYDLVLIAPDK